MEEVCLSGHEAWVQLPILHKNEALWCTLVIPALGRWRQEEQKFKIILGYIANLRVA